MTTSPNLVLRGADAASAAFWLRFNPGSGAADGSHAVLLATEGWSPLTIFVGFTHDRLIQVWWNQDGPTYQLPRADATYHIATTFDAGLVRLYVNGALVASQTVVRPLASPGPGHIQLGPTATGLDVTFDDPTLWSGHALTLAEVRALRDRTSAPEDIAPGNIAWRLTLDGTAGTAAAVGDAGLDGLGFAGADVMQVSDPAPVYVAGPLVYESARVRSARIGASGKTLALLIEDASGNLADLTAVEAHPTIVVDGGAPIPLANPTWGVSGSDRLPYVVYPLPGVIPISANVAITVEEGWATTATQRVAGLAAVPVANGPGRGYLPPFVAGPKTMAPGFNIQLPAYYLPSPLYANLMKQSSQVLDSSGLGFTEDVDGYPTSGGGLYCIPSWSAYPVAPAGTWTLRWDGAVAVALEAKPESGTTVTPFASGGVPQAAGNWATYVVAHEPPAGGGEPAYSPAVQVTLPVGARNIRLYPPGVAADDSQVFHPEILRMLAGTRSIRFVHAGNTINSSVTRADHFKTRAARSVYVGAGPWDRATITSVGPTDTGDSYYDGYTAGGWFPMTFTTAAPHGFDTGQTVRIEAPFGPIALADGRTYTVSAGSTGGVIRVHSPTSFSFAVWIEGGSTAVAGVQAVSGTAIVERAAGMPHADMAELCNQVGCDAWVCVPHALDDAGVAAMAQALAFGLAPGRKCRVEYSNECWNPAYAEHHFCVWQGNLAGLEWMQWYAQRAGEVHALFAAVFSAAGRAGDLVRVFGSQGARVGVAQTIVNYCVARAIPIDELAVAPYFNNGPESSALTEAWDALDIEQLHDLSDLYVQHHWYYYGQVAEHGLILNAAFPTARVVCYEGGPENGCINGSSAALKSARSWAWGRHPRMRRLMLQYYQQQQDQGCTLFNEFILADAKGNSLGVAANWPVYSAVGQLPGAGDGSDGRFDNRTGPEALDRIVSVVGGAIDAWEALVDGGVPALTYSLSGAARPRVRAATPLILTPSGNVDRVAVMLDDGGAGGSFTPNPVTLAGAVPVQCTYVPTAVGRVRITARNLNGLADPTPLEFDVLPSLRTFPPPMWYPGLRR